MIDDVKDTGDIAAVKPGERLEVDDAEPNEDAGEDLSGIPDGEIVSIDEEA